MAKYAHILCYTCFTGVSGLTIVTGNSFFCYRIWNILLYCYNFHSDIYLPSRFTGCKGLLSPHDADGLKCIFCKFFLHAECNLTGKAVA